MQSGTVKVDQHAGSAALYTPTNQAPGQATTGCVRVAYSGSLGAAVKLYTPSTITNGTLYNLKVERGSGLTTLDGTMSCAGFAPDATNPVAYDSPLGSFGQSWASGIAAKDAGAAWATNDPKDYRFTITQNDDTTPNARTTPNSSGVHSFTWEARNLGDYSTKVLNTPGLVAYWRLGESSGTSAADSQGTNTGTYINGPALGRPGAITDTDTAPSFDGVDDYVSVPDAASLNPTAVSVEAWVKSATPTWNSTGFVVSKRDSYILHPLPGARTMQFYVRGAGSWPAAAVTPTDITVWHHYVGTYDGSTLRVRRAGGEQCSGGLGCRQPWSCAPHRP